MNNNDTYFLPYQENWIIDESPLRIIQKSRQIGITYADAYDSVTKASPGDARLDVWISSRDQVKAKLYLEDCKYWAVFLHLYFLDPKKVSWTEWPVMVQNPAINQICARKRYETSNEHKCRSHTQPEIPFARERKPF